MRSRSEVISQAKKDGKTVHFSKLMDLCHLKNADANTSRNTRSELCSAETTSKTRKDTEAVFAEQGASASDGSGKILSKLTGMAGETGDAIERTLKFK